MKRAIVTKPCTFAVVSMRHLIEAGDGEYGARVIAENLARSQPGKGVALVQWVDGYQTKAATTPRKAKKRANTKTT